MNFYGLIMSGAVVTISDAARVFSPCDFFPCGGALWCCSAEIGGAFPRPDFTPEKLNDHISTLIAEGHTITVRALAEPVKAETWTAARFSFLPMRGGKNHAL